jgi:hypothetical protein
MYRIILSKFAVHILSFVSSNVLIAENCSDRVRYCAAKALTNRV